MFAAILLILAFLPQPSAVLRDSCDLVEVNHFYGPCGHLVFDQLILWDWSECEAKYNVRDWRLIKSPGQFPARDHARGGYSAAWLDGEQLRSIRATHYRETFTQYDPELLEREYLPKDKRRELRQGSK